MTNSTLRLNVVTREDIIAELLEGAREDHPETPVAALEMAVRAEAREVAEAHAIATFLAQHPVHRDYVIGYLSYEESDDESAHLRLVNAN